MYKLSAIAALSFPLLAAAAPTSRITRRDGITCTKTYGGGLVAMNLQNTPENTVPKQTNVYLDDNGNLAADLSGANAAMMVEFDTCTTDGWNIDGQQYGQVKPLDDYYNCLTVANTTGPATLNIQPCTSSNDGILQSQWFMGQWDDQGGFHVISTGNPNADRDNRPYVGFAYGDVEIPNPNEITVKSPDPTIVTEFQFSGIRYF